MPRQSRQKSGTGIYHVMLRGINRQDIFEEDADYAQFINILSCINHKEAEDVVCCRIYAYCLMSNHIHLLIEEKDWPLSKIIKSIASSYVFFFNKKYGRVGHLFQDRFLSEPCDTREYFFTLFRYIHQNPVKSGSVRDASNYPFSSWANDYVNKKDPYVCYIFPVLRRMPLESLKLLVDTPLPEDSHCLDINDEVRVVADEVVRRRLLEISKTLNITSFQFISKQLQKEHIAYVMEELNVGPRQLARITGMSYSVIQRIKDKIQ